MLLLIGQPVNMYLKFGEEDGKAYVQTDNYSSSTKYYKVSNSTSEPGSVNLVLIIIIIVAVVIIIIVVVIVVVLSCKKKGSTKKLPPNNAPKQTNNSV